MPVPEGFILDNQSNVKPAALPEGFVLDGEAPQMELQPAHTPGAAVSPQFRQPTLNEQRQVMGVSHPGTKIFKTPEETKQAAGELTGTALSGVMGVSKGVTLGLATPLVDEATKDMPTIGLTPNPVAEGTGQFIGTVVPWGAISKGVQAATGLNDLTAAGRVATQALTGGVVGGVNAQNEGRDAVNEAAIGGATAGALTGAFELPGVVRNSLWYRKLTVPERGLVVQTFDDAVKSGASEAELARMNTEYFQEALKRRMAPETSRPNHDNLSEGIPAVASAELQSIAPEVKPVVKGTKAEILDLTKQDGTQGKVIYTAGDTAYLIDPKAVQGIYGGSISESLRRAKLDLKKGGDAESNLLGYTPREGLTPDQTIDAAVTKQGEVITDLPAMKEAKNTGNIVWAAEGRPDEVTAKAAEVAQAIQQKGVMPSEGNQNAKGNAAEGDAAQGREEGLLSDSQPGEKAPQVTGGQPSATAKTIFDAEQEALAQKLMKHGVEENSPLWNDVMGHARETRRDLDPMTGAQTRTEFYKALPAMFERHQQTGEPVSYAVFDVGNVSGMNNALGKANVDPHIKAIYDIVKTTLEENGITDGQYFRNGGDEFQVVSAQPKEILDKALSQASDKVIRYEQEAGIADIPHTKGSKPGTNLYYATENFKEWPDVEKMIEKADIRVERQKDIVKEAYKNGQINKAESLGAVASGGQAGRTGKGIGTPRGGAGEIPDQSRTGIPAEVAPSIITPEVSEPLNIPTGAPSGFADTGGYNLTAKSAIEMPEITEIARELMNGKYPRVMERLSKDTALGQFFPKSEGDITLKAEIFKTPGLAERVLSHEIGHLADYLPDQTMKRGNILGRVATMKKYMKWVLANPGITTIDRTTILTELKVLTQQWKPFNPTADPKYTKYRFSAPELYADAVSVLFNDPALLQHVAPKFHSAFFSYLDRKPEVKAIYEGIQQRLTDPAAVEQHRLDEMYRMNAEGNRKRAEQIERRKQEGEGIVHSVAKRLVDERFGAKSVIDTIRKTTGNDPVADTALQKLEDLPYLSSEVSDVLYELNSSVIKPMEDAGVNNADLSIYLFAKRVIGEEYKKGLDDQGNIIDISDNKAAAMGHTPETAKRLIATLEQHLGPEKFVAVEKAAKDYRQFRVNRLIPEFEKSGYFSPEQIQTMKDREDYVRFFGQRFLEDDAAGFGGFSTTIHQRYGSLQEIDNTFVATMLQDLSFLRAIRINDAKKSFVNVLQLGGPDFIKPADLKYSLDRKGRVPVPPKDPELAILQWKDNGKWQYGYIDKELADAFDTHSVVATKMATFWNNLTQPFKELFVSKNPKWLLRNLIRDPQRTLINLDDLQLRDVFTLMRAYASTGKEVWSYSHGNSRSPLIRQMLVEKSLPVKRTWGSRDVTADDEITNLIVEYGLSPDGHKKQNLALRAWNWLENTASASDVWGKAAANKVIMEKGQRTDASRITAVRNRVATPNFKNRGSWNPVTNSIAMFSNVGVQGLRSMRQSFKANPGRYMWKQFVLNILPKLTLAAGAAGYLGKKYHDVINKVPEYDKRISTIIPLWVDDQHKAHYLTIPADYDGQFVGSLTWAMTQGHFFGKDSVASTLNSANPYSLHPLLALGATWGDYYMRGQNPVDDFRGNNILTEDQFTAGGTEAAKALGKNSANQMLGQFYRFEPDTIQADKTAQQEFLNKFPGNLAGVFYKVSDKGDSERIQDAVNLVKKDEAKARIKSREALTKMVKGETLTPEEITAIAVHPGDIDGKVTKMLMKKHGMIYISALLNAKSPKEKIAVLNLMQESK